MKIINVFTIVRVSITFHFLQVTQVRIRTQMMSLNGQIVIFSTEKIIDFASNYFIQMFKQKEMFRRIKMCTENEEKENDKIKSELNW